MGQHTEIAPSGDVGAAAPTVAEALRAAVARNVRESRLARGLTLEELASRSGVSRAMIVEVEQGRTNASIATLSHLAEALGRSVAKLVEVSETSAVRVIPAAERVELWRGEAGGLGLLCAGAERPHPCELWDCRMEPGERYDADAHVPGTRELLHMLEGRLTLVVGGERHELGPGDSAVFRADRQHAYANESGKAARHVLVMLPPGIEDDADGI